MAMTIRRARGDYVDYTAGTETAAGTVVELNAVENTIGVAEATIEANRPGALAVTGHFDVPKANASDVFVVGDRLDITAGTDATAAAGVSGNHMCVAASANGDAYVKAAINVDVGA